MHLVAHLLFVLMSLALAQPVEQAAISCSSICTTYSTTLTTSLKDIITATTTVFGATHTAKVTSVTTLTPGCPATTSIAKRQVDIAVGDACPCKTATTTTLETEYVTKTRTKTVKIPTTTMTTIISTVTPSSFYLQSSFDNNGFAYINNQASYYLLNFAPCDNDTALFTFNGTSLIGPDGSVANNGQCCGASGLPFAFSFIDNPGVTALTCSSTSNVLACGVGSASQTFEDCYGDLLLGGSHLCDATTITLVKPSFS